MDASQVQLRDDGRILVPYDSNVTDPRILVTIWDKIEEEGLKAVIFHDNPRITLLQFIGFMSAVETKLQVFARRDELTGGKKMVGIAWLSNLQRCDGILTKGIGSFCFFKDYQKPEFTGPFAELGLDFWFNVLKVDTIAGMTPSRNRAALAFVKRLGFQERGRLVEYVTYEGLPDDGVVTMMTAVEYATRSRKIA